MNVRPAVLATGISLVASLSLSACGGDDAPAAPPIENVLGVVLRGRVGVAGAELRRSCYAGEDGGLACDSSVSSPHGTFFFPKRPRPYDLRVFDAQNTTEARRLTGVVGLTIGDPVIRLEHEGPAAPWRTRVDLRLDDDAEVVKGDDVRTIVLAAGPRFTGSNVSPQSPDTVAGLDLSWEGTFQSFVFVHALRVSGQGAGLRYLAHGWVGLLAAGGRTYEARIVLRPIQTQRVKVDVTAPRDFSAKVTAGIDFGYDGMSAALYTDLPAGSTELTYPKVDGARVVMTGLAERDGERSIVTPYPTSLPTDDRTVKVDFSAPATLVEPVADATVALLPSALQQQGDPGPRFSWTISAPTTNGSAPPGWVHFVDVVPEEPSADRVPFRIVTHATSATLPSIDTLGVSPQDGKPASLPLPSGTYRWTVASFPDLPHVDAWASKFFDPRYGRSVASRTRRITFSR